MTPQQIDTNLKTSFVPKTPAAAPVPGLAPKRRRKGTPLLMFLGIFIFVVGALFSGGVYAFQQLVQQDITELESSLARVQQVVDLNSLQEIEAVDAQLRLTESVYSNHRVLAPLFRLLENETTPEVRYVNFGYMGNGAINLAGEAESYEAIAQQSDIFSNSGVVADHIFSGFVLSEFGRVSFSLQITPADPVTQYVTN